MYKACEYECEYIFFILQRFQRLTGNVLSILDNVCLPRNVDIFGNSMDLPSGILLWNKVSSNWHSFKYASNGKYGFTKQGKAKGNCCRGALSNLPTKKTSLAF